jgi:hypothetical protein
MAGQTQWTIATTNLIAALNAAGSPATVWRARFEDVSADETAFNVFPTKISVRQDHANDSAGISAAIVVRGYIAATNEVDLAADALVLWAWKQARLDPTLGQVVSDCYVEDIELGYVDKSATDQVCADITFRVEMEVGRNDPSVNKTYIGG